MVSALNSSTPDAATEEILIELRGVQKRFGPLQVLRGIDLALKRGQTTAVIGDSGAGKSVILKHIVRLLRPDAGSVYFHGQRIDQLSERDLTRLRMRFGFLFQMGALFDSLTVAENVAFPLVEHRRLKRREVADIVARKLHMVGLDGTQNKRPAELSGGQRKRVALARAIALDPEVILYDEPTTGLDPARSDVINELIRKLQRELNVTGIVVTHDMHSVFKVADRVVMIDQGRFIFDGTLDEVRGTAVPRVRQFVEGRASDEDIQSLNQ